MFKLAWCLILSYWRRFPRFVECMEHSQSLKPGKKTGNLSGIPVVYHFADYSANTPHIDSSDQVVNRAGRQHNPSMIPRPALFSLLAALLILVQSQGVWHKHDLAAHADGDLCEFCVGLAALDHGLPVVVHLPLPLTGVTPIEPVYSTTPVIPAPIIPYSSRAPPARGLA
jgi:hypothetical protein